MKTRPGMPVSLPLNFNLKLKRFEARLAEAALAEESALRPFKLGSFGMEATPDLPGCILLVVVVDLNCA
jgi:hypothetical protein